MDPAGTSEFLTRISDTLIDLGPSGVQLVSLDLDPARREALFAQPAGERPVGDRSDRPAEQLFPLAQPPASGRFATHEERRATFWQPAADAPAYIQLAWLLSELGDDTLLLREVGLTLTAVRADDPGQMWADLLLDHRPSITVPPAPGTGGPAPSGRRHYTAGYEPPAAAADLAREEASQGEVVTYGVRVQLTGRDEPLEFPGSYLAEMFSEGRQHRWSAPAPEGAPSLVDLRGVL